MSQKTYRIGEAAAKLNLKSYVLRFWETEFSQIAPIRTEKGQRLYTESDLAVLARIRFLLHERGLTIDGARRLLREEAEKGTLFTASAVQPDDCLDDLDGAEDSDGDDDNDMEDCPNVPARNPGGTSPGPGEVKEKEYGPVQASLFAAGEPAPGGVAENELREIVTELAAIHHLLVFEASGEKP